MRYALLLNSTYEPMRFISEKRAIKLLIKNKAQVLSVWNDVVSSVSVSVNVPSVVRLNSYIAIRNTKTRFNKKIVYFRDKYTCQYCGKQLNCLNATIDHVVPRCCGGKTSWKNCVTCCKACNIKKSDKRLEQLTDMRLLTAPRVPDAKTSVLYTMNIGDVWNEAWAEFV